MKVSVIIINYNYGHYLSDAIESVISQTYSDMEIIVVDDGSTDDSRSIIKSYGDSVERVFQSNRGMAEASNAGFNKSQGEIIMFLDADDYLNKYAAERVVNIWDENCSKVHFRLLKVDKYGKKIGYVPNKNKSLSSGEVGEKILKYGSYNTPPTSGNAFSREVLLKLFPIKNIKVNSGTTYLEKITTDAYLKRKVPFFGHVKSINQVLGYYRIHGNNSGASKSQLCNKLKRQRILNVVRTDTEFIKKSFDFNGHWDEEFLFRDVKLMRLRLLSYRFDGGDHLWTNDNKILLIKYTIVQSYKNEQLFNIKNGLQIISLLLISVLPEKVICKLSTYLY